MKYSNSIQQFFSLLRAGLWGGGIEEYAFQSDVEWKEVIRVAREQACLGITFDGLELLQSCRPNKKQLMEWFSYVQRIEHANSIVNGAIVSIISKYRDAGVEPILLKGQGVAQYYRTPKHRQSGDIDLYLPKIYDKINAMLEEWPNVKVHEETIHHKSFSVFGIEIENHRCFVHFYANYNQDVWESIIGECPNMTERIELTDKSGRTFPLMVLNPQMNAIYLYLHIQHHLLLTGIGLRQICDWACLWKKREKDIDKDLFLKIVDILPVKRCMTALTWIVVNYLGLDEGIIPLNIKTDIARKDGEFLLRDILDSGNFGRSSGVMDGFVRNSHWNNLRNYTKALKRMMRLRHLCPSEVDAYICYWIKDKMNAMMR